VTLTVSHKLPTEDNITQLLFDLLYSTDADATTFNWQMQSANSQPASEAIAQPIGELENVLDVHCPCFPNWEESLVCTIHMINIPFPVNTLEICFKILS